MAVLDKAQQDLVLLAMQASDHLGDVARAACEFIESTEDIRNPTLAKLVLRNLDDAIAKARMAMRDVNKLRSS